MIIWHSTKINWSHKIHQVFLYFFDKIKSIITIRLTQTKEDYSKNKWHQSYNILRSNVSLNTYFQVNSQIKRFVFLIILFSWFAI